MRRQDVALVEGINAVSDERALGHIRASREAEDGAALAALGEALKFATSLATLDLIVEGVDEIAEHATRNVRAEAEALAARARRKRQRAIEPKRGDL